MDLGVASQGTGARHLYKHIACVYNMRGRMRMMYVCVLIEMALYLEVGWRAVTTPHHQR